MIRRTMDIAPFRIEAFFARYEFNTPFLLCASDCETLTVDALLQLAGRTAADLAALPLGYTESRGSPALRVRVAATYRAVSPEEVIVLAAPEEGIYLVMRALLEAGDHVVVQTPAFDSLLNLAEHISGNVTAWPVEAGDGHWRFDLDRLAAAVTPQTRLIVVNFPHNPTGFLPAVEELEAIVELAERHGAWLFCDEMYRGLELPGTATLPSAGELYERAVVLSGLSKVYGLPGLRAGWLLVRDAALRERLVNWKFYTSICAPAPSEFLAEVALGVRRQLAARSIQLIERNLALAESFFARWPDRFSWRPPRAGSVALVGLDVPSAADYCRRLAEEAGVLLLPSSSFGYGDQHVRMGFGRANFPEALARYESYLREYPW